MDDKGRLHMPGFVGETFEKTGLDKKKEAIRARADDEALSAEENRLAHIPLNRHNRRLYEKQLRQRAK